MKWLVVVTAVQRRGLRRQTVLHQPVQLRAPGQLSFTVSATTDLGKQVGSERPVLAAQRVAVAADLRLTVDALRPSPRAIARSEVPVRSWSAMLSRSSGLRNRSLIVGGVA